ncbi:MAG: glycerophosphodiester phosphodiesterase [Candidatus Binatia bacterium]
MTHLADYPFFSGPKPRIIGHRGASGTAPENTLLSFRQAFQEGADFVELDVHQCLDGAIVIIHDATLERTTNGSGEVSARSVQDLKSVDAGYRFTFGRGAAYPFRGQKLEIPTLEDFFLGFPQARAIVEIKHFSPSIVQRTLDIILTFHAEDRVLLATEEDAVMAAIRTELKRGDRAMATGFSYGEVAAFVHWAQSGMATSYQPPGQAFQIPPVYNNVALVTPETVGAAHQLDLEMFVWTINQTEEMQRLLNLGVDGIITDYPSRLRDIVGRTR